ncbi:MAG: SRPBCC family protein [Acidimicrobiia bacterium]
MAEGTVQSIEIPASPEFIYEVLADLELYPEWITAMREVEILERDEDDRPRRAHFRVDAMIKEIAYDLEYVHEPPFLMSWTAVPGDDIRQMVGSYELMALEGGETDVVYALMVEPEFKVPGFLRRQAEKQLIGTALRGLKRRVEELSSG